MSEHPLTVIQEFQERANDAAGVHGVSLAGLIVFASVAEQNQPANPTEDSSLFLGHGDPNAPEGFAYQRWKFTELEAKLGPNGEVARTLGQQWVVLVASLWNDHYRQRLATAKGVELNEVKDPYLADINRMRNDIVHHQGIATTRNTGRCEILKWFQLGDTMHVTPAHVAEFMDYLGMLEASDDIGGGPWQQRAGF